MRAPITDKHLLEMMWERFPEIMQRGAEQPAPAITPEHLLALAQVANLELDKVNKVFQMEPPVQEPDAIVTSLTAGPDGVARSGLDRELPLMAGVYLAPQPAQQEPVAWKLMPRKATDEMLKAMDECSTEGYDERLYAGHASSVYTAAWDSLPEVKHELNCVCGAIWEGDELVCTPHPPAQRKPLTDEQKKELFKEWANARGVWPRLTHEEIFYAGIEAAHGIKGDA